MVSDIKLAANRANLKKSTGPKTEKRKRRSSMNAFKHGLLASQLLLRDEDSNTFIRFSEGLQEAIQPESELEEVLFERILSASWRLKRMGRIEVDIFEVGRTLDRGDGEQANLGLAFIRDGNRGDGLGKLSRYETCIENRLG